MNLSQPAATVHPRAVTAEDRKSFRRWLRAGKSRYVATHGMRVRPELRPDHARITSGSVAIGMDIRESVARALAVLALQAGAEENPRSLLSAWVGRSQDVANLAMALLKSERDSLRRHVVFGLWCQDDGCRRFICPVAVEPRQAPGTFAMSEVCGRCQCVTVMWRGEEGLWVQSAPTLKGQAHPMKPFFVSAWVRAERPQANRPAPLIEP